MPPTTPKSLATLYISLLVTTVLAALLVVALIWLDTRAKAEDDQVRHTLNVRNQIGEVIALVQRAEASQRGYLLTGNDTFLPSYDAAMKTLPAALDAVANLTEDNPRQRETIRQIRKVIAAKLGEMNSTIAERKAGHADAALATVNTGEGGRLMSEIRDRVSDVRSEESRLLAIRRGNSTTLDTLLQAGAAIVFLLICAVGALVSYFTRRSFIELATIRDQLILSNQDLLEQVSRREAAEGQLRQAQKMEAIGQLTGGIAHDFNNMLGVILGSLDMMRRRIGKGDFGIERFMDAAQKAGERAAILTHRLLAFARQQPLEPESIDANRMIANMSDLLRSTFSEQIRIETVAAAGLWTSHVDTHQLESAILNVAINARDAMPDGGKLTIETANAFLDDAYCKEHLDVTAGQYVMIAISDTGAGMTSDIVTRVFDPFFTTKAAGKGTGLGLSQVYGFVKQSHGHIKIYSEPDAGTTVKIYLPRYAGKAEDIDRRTLRETQTGNSQEVILVVEDDALMLRVSTEALRELGYTVVDCDNAAAALAILDSRADVKLLFTDVVMPDTNGRKLADEARRRRPDLKVLFTTGYTQNAVVHGGVLDAGVNLLTKPFALDQLAAKIRMVLDK